MRSAYRVLASLVALGVFVQAAAIAFGWFDVIHDLDNGTVLDEDFEGNAGHVIHGMNGMMVMPILGLLLFISSFFAKFPGAVKWAGFVLLAIVVQVALGIFAFSLPAVGALHGANALIVLGLAVSAALRATRAGDANTTTASTTSDETVGARAV